ncbi:MAG: Pectate lyase superfamily protein [Verrucomicrobiota bacterium]|jgi:hypothetical protein
MPTLEGTFHRLALNQASVGGSLDTLPAAGPVIARGSTAVIDVALFKSAPAAASFVSNVSNLTSATLIVRKRDAFGTVLISKTITSGFTSITYPDWLAGNNKHFRFSLSAVETNQSLPANGSLPIFFVVAVTTATRQFVVGSGYGRIVEVGNIGVTVPLAATLPTSTVSGDLTVQGNGLVTGDLASNGSFFANNFRGSINGAINIKDTCNGNCTAAVGDGVVDDTVAINQHIVYAAAQNRMVYAPDGIYKITATLRIAIMGSTYCQGIVGAGAGTIFTTTANIPHITVDTITGRMDFVELGGFTLINNGPVANTSDCGILFCDTAVTPTAQNRINRCNVHDILFLGCSIGVHSTRNPSDGVGEVGFDWNRFSRLTNDAIPSNDSPTPHQRIPRYFIKLDKGSGTGNIYSDLIGGSSEAFFSVGAAGSGQNVGDIIISQFHMAGVSGGHAKGIELIGGGAYASNVSIVSLQADAGIVTALDVSDINQINVTGGNWSDNILINFTRCDYIKLESGAYPTTTFTSCGPHKTWFGPGNLNLGQYLIVPQISTGEPWTGAPTKALAIGAVAKAVAPSGGQNTILFQTSDLTNPLVASFGLNTGPTANERSFSISIIEQNVGWKPVVIGGGSGLAIGTGTFANPGEGMATVAGVIFRPHAGPPVAAVEGLCYLDSNDHHFYGYNGTTWKQIDN